MTGSVFGPVTHIVNLGKLKRTLKREFTRSPVKSCVLIGLLPVAGYFVLPLILKSKGPAPASEQTALQMNPLIVTSSLTAPLEQAVSVDWQETVRRMQADRFMSPIEYADRRDPFHLAVDAAQPMTPEKNDEDDWLRRLQRPDWNDRLGVRLTGTIVGRKARMATINGRTYREHEHLQLVDRADDDKVDGRFTFTLSYVARDHVLLQQGDTQLRLPLKRKPIRGTISFSGR